MSSELKNLEKSLKKLVAKPRLGFRIALMLKLRLRMYQLTWRQNRSWKVAFSMAVLAVFMSGILGVNYWNYRTSYAYHVDRAEASLNEMTVLLESKNSVSWRWIPKASANSSSSDEDILTDLTADIIHESELAMEKADDLDDSSDLTTALAVIDNLHQRELRVFGQAAEVIRGENALITLQSALTATYENARQIKNNLNIVKGAASEKRIVVDLKPVVESAIKIRDNFTEKRFNNEPISKERVRNHLFSQKPKILAENLLGRKNIAEESLKRIVTNKQKTRDSAELSERYLKAISALERQETWKAYTLFTAIETESRLIAEVQDEKLTPIAMIATPSEANGEGGSIENPVENSVSEPTATATETSETSTAATSQESMIAFSPQETVEFVGDLLSEKDEAATTGASASTVSDTGSGASDVPAAESAAATAFTAAKQSDLPLEDKKRIWKDEKDRQILTEKQQRLDKEKARLLEESQKKEEEKRRIEEAKAKLEEEQRQIEIERQKRAEDEAERKKIEAELGTKIDEEKRLAEEKRRLEEERQIKERLAQEKDRLEQELQKKEEEKRRIEEARKKVEAVQEQVSTAIEQKTEAIVSRLEKIGDSESKKDTNKDSSGGSGAGSGSSSGSGANVGSESNATTATGSGVTSQGSESSGTSGGNASEVNQVSNPVSAGNLAMSGSATVTGSGKTASSSESSAVKEASSGSAPVSDNVTNNNDSNTGSEAGTKSESGAETGATGKTETTVPNKTQEGSQSSSTKSVGSGTRVPDVVKNFGNTIRSRR